MFENRIRFGILSGQQAATFEDYLALWRKTEALGFDTASVMDHIIPVLATDPDAPCFEGLTTLAAMAASTEKLYCGVLAIAVTFRNPALLAKMAATIDHISNGRMELCIGGAWFHREHEQYGYEFPPIGERLRMLGEAAQILKLMWTQPRTTFHGRYYSVNDAVCEPKPVRQPHLPLWIGGGGEKVTLRIAAEHGDGWNGWLFPTEIYQRKVDALARHCESVGRDPATVRRAMNFQAIVGETPQEVEERGRRLASSWGDYDDMRQRSVLGSPEECVEQLLAYVNLGVSDFVMNVRQPADLRALELVAEKVMPVVRREGDLILARR
jgi:F420-dependent oxidoreductase-like protein